jgi:hypothetical protein
MELAQDHKDPGLIPLNSLVSFILSPGKYCDCYTVKFERKLCTASIVAET